MWSSHMKELEKLDKNQKAKFREMADYLNEYEYREFLKTVKKHDPFAIEEDPDVDVDD